MSEELSYPPSFIPDLEKTVVTDDTEQSDGSENGRHDERGDETETTMDQLPNAVMDNTLQDLSIGYYYENHNKVACLTPVSEHESLETTPGIVRYHQGCVNAISSQESSQEPSQNDDEGKEEPSSLIEPHDLVDSLGEPLEDCSYSDQLPTRCVICGTDNGKPLLRFHPVDHDLLVSAAAPAVNSFTQAIALHVFCGRTASILPNINRPDLEILTKAGIKNKHGIGQEVNGALSRTRSATVTEPGSKEKQFYLVREFEANLAAVRNTFIHHHPPAELSLVLNNYLPGCPQPAAVIPQVEAFMDMPRQVEDMMYDMHAETFGEVPSPPRKKSKSVKSKIFCECGGCYSNASSFRNHVKSRRHQRWEESTRGSV